MKATGLHDLSLETDVVESKGAEAGDGRDGRRFGTRATLAGRFLHDSGLSVPVSEEEDPS